MLTGKWKEWYLHRYMAQAQGQPPQLLVTEPDDSSTQANTKLLSNTETAWNFSSCVPTPRVDPKCNFQPELSIAWNLSFIKELWRRNPEHVLPCWLWLTSWETLGKSPFKEDADFHCHMQSQEVKTPQVILPFYAFSVLLSVYYDFYLYFQLNIDPVLPPIFML